MIMVDQPPAIVAPAPNLIAHEQLIAVIATGRQADLNRLEIETNSMGIDCKQLDGPDGHELLVGFRPGTSPDLINKYLVRLRSGAFATLTFQSAVAPPSR